jgi:hypothetical protein
MAYGVRIGPFKVRKEAAAPATRRTPPVAGAVTVEAAPQERPGIMDVVALAIRGTGAVGVEAAR